MFGLVATATLAKTGLRLALGTAFLSAVASRLGLWGHWGGNWAKFVTYAGQINWYLPTPLIPATAVAATICELTLGVWLLSGLRVRAAAYGSSVLLMIFALAMLSGDPKSPFDYSVFTASFGALLLAATQPSTQEKNI